MEVPNVDIKPIIPTDDVPGKSLLTDPSICTGKLKQSRYEDVWPEDVHAAFMEAVALYPPMGKRRLKYYRVSTHENEHFSDANRAKSFGRCQLIQSYILEKTGKNRSRKQVSSHLQRLKKIHKDNPAMHPLFLEAPSEQYSIPQAVATSSQDTFANISFSTCHLQSDFDLSGNVHNLDVNTNSSSTFPCAPEVSSLNGVSCNTPDLPTKFHPSILFTRELLSPQQSAPGTLHPSDSDYLSELQDSLLFKDGGFRSSSAAFNTSTFSISMRRLASRLQVPLQSRLDTTHPAMHFSRAFHTSTLQPTHQWISHDGLMDGLPCNNPLAPAQHPAFHAPLYSPKLFPVEKQRQDSDFVSDWMWPQISEIGLVPRAAPFGSIHPRYLPTVYQPNSTCLETSVDPPVFHSSPSESEVPQLSEELSYPYAITSPATMSESVSTESAINSPGSSENLASPLVIRPTPIYPDSYVHSNGPHYSLANLTSSSLECQSIVM